MSSTSTAVHTLNLFLILFLINLRPSKPHHIHSLLHTTITMRLSTTLLSGLSLALGATAFLVPPQVSDEALAAANLNLDMDWDLDTLRDSLPDSVKSGQHVEVQLTPHERTPADTLSTTEVKKYDFGERLTLDFAAGDHAVYVNDIEIYPQPAQAPITVDRAFSLADGPGPAETLRLSTRMDFGKMGEKDESGISRLPCKLEVLGVEDMVLDFEVVEFDILEDLAGYVRSPTKPPPDRAYIR